MKELTFPRKTFPQIMNGLVQLDVVFGSYEVEDNVYVCKTRNGWRSAAKVASAYNNGSFTDKPSGFQWQNGPKSYYAMRQDTYHKIKEVRQKVIEHTGLTPNWSYGSCARKCLEFCFPKHEAKEWDSKIDIAERIGYHQCTVGKWEHGINYDINHCYFQMIKRLESPRVSILQNGEIDFVRLNAEQTAKWNDTLDFMQDIKMLRNSVWGSMLGSVSERYCFKHGVEKPAWRDTGYSYAAGALVGRSAFEVCWTVSGDTNAVYAQTDGFIVVDNSKPEYLSQIGLNYRVESEGETETHGQHRYICGDKETEYFYRDSIIRDPVERPENIGEMWHTKWLW